MTHLGGLLLDYGKCGELYDCALEGEALLRKFAPNLPPIEFKVKSQ